MKRIFLAFVLLLGLKAFSQGGYDIKINIKNLKDDTVYLAKYTFDKQFIVDTCKKVIGGNIVFKGKNVVLRNWIEPSTLRCASRCNREYRADIDLDLVFSTVVSDRRLRSE